MSELIELFRNGSLRPDSMSRYVVVCGDVDLALDWCVANLGIRKSLVVPTVHPRHTQRYFFFGHLGVPHMWMRQYLGTDAGQQTSNPLWIKVRDEETLSFVMSYLQSKGFTVKPSISTNIDILKSLMLVSQTLKLAICLLVYQQCPVDPGRVNGTIYDTPVEDSSGANA